MKAVVQPVQPGYAVKPKRRTVADKERVERFLEKLANKREKRDKPWKMI